MVFTQNQLKNLFEAWETVGNRSERITVLIQKYALAKKKDVDDSELDMDLADLARLEQFIRDVNNATKDFVSNIPRL